MEFEDKWSYKEHKALEAKYYHSIKEEDPLDENMDKESHVDNDEDFNNDEDEYFHKEEDCIRDEQLDEGYEIYDEDYYSEKYSDEDLDEEYDF